MEEDSRGRVREIRFVLDPEEDAIDRDDGRPQEPTAKRMRCGAAVGTTHTEANSVQSDVGPRARSKVQELFFTWLCDVGAQRTIERLVDDALSGREFDRPSPTHLPSGYQRRSLHTPKSPVSHLIRTSATFPPSPVFQPRPGMEPSFTKLAPGSPQESHSSPPPMRDLQYSASNLSSLSRRTSFGSVGGEGKTDGSVLKRFYFPMGRINPPDHDAEELAAIRELFRETSSHHSTDDDVDPGQELASLVVDVIGLPSFLTLHVYRQMVKNPLAALSDCQKVSEEMFLVFFRHYCIGKSGHARLFYILLDNADRNYLDRESLRCVLDGVLQFHPGLTFLRNTPEFQARYAETVIERVFYSCAHHNTRSLFLGDIVKSGLLECLMWLDQQNDINLERRFFSYKHFYVLYCRFWELDLDHDLIISVDDLLKYGNGCLTVRIVERIFAGCGRLNDCQERDRLVYTDFVWFCLSEEDKKTPRALDYWFRCIDLDGDGVITLDDMEYFYREQYSRMEDRGHEPIQFVDIVCQLLDMLRFPTEKTPLIRKKDLRLCNMQSVFFNFLFNLNKFFQIESRDPRLIQQERAMPDASDWDRFAAAEYDRLVPNQDELVGLGSDQSVPDMEL